MGALMEIRHWFRDDYRLGSWSPRNWAFANMFAASGGWKLPPLGCFVSSLRFGVVSVEDNLRDRSGDNDAVAGGHGTVPTSDTGTKLLIYLLNKINYLHWIT